VVVEAAVGTTNTSPGVAAAEAEASPTTANSQSNGVTATRIRVFSSSRCTAEDSPSSLNILSTLRLLQVHLNNTIATITTEVKGPGAVLH
jgi:hypothetical protein